MLSMFRLAKNQTVATWCSRYGCVSALTQKQEISTSKTAAGSSKTKATKTSASSTNTSAGLLIEVNKGAVGVISQLAIRSPPRSNKKFLWTAEKDAVLQEGIMKHRRDGWAKVADFVGGGVKDHQCRNRCVNLEGLAQQGVQRGAWDPEEIRRLEKLVPQYLVRSYWSTQLKKLTEEYIDWAGVGKELGRVPRDCSNQWKLHQWAHLKKGHFTAEEDAIIRRRVAEREGEGSGLWVALQKELGRPSVTIYKRWNVLSTTFRFAGLNFWWSETMDEKLKEVVAKHKAEGWAKVAEYVGGGVTDLQCINRWNTYHAAMQRGNVTRGAWEQEEVDKLAELVPQHVVPSYWCVRSKRMTMEYINWVGVAAKLGRLPIDCTVRWRALRNATMKKGPLTDSEEAIIRERVERWGDKRPAGLWVGLEKDLGRPAKRIRERWIAVLSKE